jgi:hypothetical protein
MQFQTKNQVITQLRKLAESHLQIRGFGYGDRWELETAMTKDDGTSIGLAHPLKQPFMWVTPIIARVNDGSLYYDFEVIVGDLVKKDESNELDVESDTLLICLDILSKFDDQSYDWSLSKQSSLQPFTEKWDSEFTGHIMNVSLEFMFNYDYCQVPFVKPDADITAFLTATGIEDEDQIFAITYLVTQLKQNGLWNKMHAIYPFVGGTASRHSINLKNPNQYKITWSPTGVTHDANGITGNGVSGYGDTGYIIAPIYKDNFHMSAYVRNDVVAGAKCAIGGSSNDSYTQLLPYLTGGLFQGSINQNVTSNVNNSSSKGYYLSCRLDSTHIRGNKNAIALINGTVNSTTVSGLKLYILSRNISGAIGYFSDYNLSIASIGESFTDSESLLMYSLVQQFQTYLNRNI